jgi:sec-independent protein translocase protein TatA
MFGSLGVPELVIILVLVLIVFGAGKLPKVMRSMGEGVREFRDASEEAGDGAGDPDTSDAASKKAEATQVEAAQSPATQSETAAEPETKSE